MTTIRARQFDTGAPVRLTVKGGRIESILPLSIPAEDLKLLPYVGPGLFDVQVNGFQGIWFSSEQLTEDQVKTVVSQYLEQGICRCFPTLITNSAEALEHGLATIRRARESSRTVRAVVAGCHVEGPFISPENGPRGAHPLRHVRPANLTELQQWQRASGGLVKLVTLAPEVSGAHSFIQGAVRQGVVISIGHTAASAEQIRLAIDTGATLGTHLGNGCAGMVPRHDNVFWPQLSDDRLTCSLIADGWHVPQSMLTCILRCKTLDRLILTSDVSGFGGCSPGRYSTGDVEVDVLSDGRILVAGQTQYLAGSGATTGECVTTFMNLCGVSLPHAWNLASFQPARSLNLPVSKLQEGAPAQLTVFRLEPDAGTSNQVRFRPEMTLVGDIVWRAATFRAY
jgi:N-acetylglucosamine-6-phosphate deacetylase